MINTTTRESAADTTNTFYNASGENLIDEFNQFFEGSASASIKDDRLIITVGRQTMEIQLPRVVGIMGRSQ